MKTGKQYEVQDRRTKVANYLSKGFNVHEIVAALGLEAGKGHGMIYGDIKFIEEERKKRRARDLDAQKGELLDELRLVRKELWVEWERSKGKQNSVTQTSRKVRPGKNLLKGGNDEGEGRENGLVDDGVTQTISAIDRTGDVRYTAQIMQCIEQEATMAGILTKEGSQDGAPPVTRFKIHTPSGYDPSADENAEKEAS